MHHAAWVVAPLVLAAVLGFSAATKIGKGELLRKIISNLRLPEWLLPAALARAVPGLELALAVGLLTPWLPVFSVAAAGVLLLMLAYWALIARGLTITPRPSCGCFGQVGDHRISWRTLMRNTILVAAATATLALASSGRTAWHLLGDGVAGDWLWLALAAMACVVTALVVMRPATPETPRAVDRTSVDPGVPPDEEDYVRTAVPRAVVVDRGVPVTLLELASRRAQLLVFIDCYCHSSQVVATDLPQWSARMPAIDVRLVFSIPHDPATRFGEVADPLLDHAGLAWEALGLTTSPSAVLLGADGMLAGGPGAGLEEVQQFVADIEVELAGAAIPETGQPQLVPEEQVTSDR